MVLQTIVSYVWTKHSTCLRLLEMYITLLILKLGFNKTCFIPYNVPKMFYKFVDWVAPDLQKHDKFICLHVLQPTVKVLSFTGSNFCGLGKIISS